jgi:hypothetical protein
MPAAAAARTADVDRARDRRQQLADNWPLREQVDLDSMDLLDFLIGLHCTRYRARPRCRAVPKQKSPIRAEANGAFSYN